MVTKQESLNIVKNTDLFEAYLRIENLFNLMNIGDEESLEGIFYSLKNDPCELVRHEAAFCLGETASLKAVDELFFVLNSNEKSEVVIHECLMSLGTIADKKSISHIEKFLHNEKFEISCSARIAIDRILQNENFEVEVSNNIDKYIKELFDYNLSNQNRRIQILFQLMKIADEKSTFAIYRCLKEDICRVVRHEAAFCLGEIASELAVDLLKSAILEEKTAIVIHEGLFALGTSGNLNALSFIEKYLEDENYIISMSAKIAIDRVKKLKNPYRGVVYYNYK